MAGKLQQVRPQRSPALADHHRLLRRRICWGGTFGNAVDANDNVWLTSYGGHAISKFDKNGKSLAGQGQLGLMQGVIVTPSTDVWVVGLSKNQVVYIPNGDPAAGSRPVDGENSRSFAKSQRTVQR